jgi:hypothetical protein
MRRRSKRWLAQLTPMKMRPPEMLKETTAKATRLMR